MLIICGTPALDSHTHSNVLTVHCGKTVFKEEIGYSCGDRNLGVGRLQLLDVPDISMICIALFIQHSIVQTQSKIMCKIYVSLLKFYFIFDFLVDRSIIQIPLAILKKKTHF
jgi:hypothetical protein